MEQHYSKTETRVLDHLKRKGNITSWEAIKEYGNTRLSATIFNLRKKGLNIVSCDKEGTNRYGDKIRYTVYFLME